MCLCVWFTSLQCYCPLKKSIFWVADAPSAPSPHKHMQSGSEPNLQLRVKCSSPTSPATEEIE